MGMRGAWRADKKAELRKALDEHRREQGLEAISGVQQTEPATPTNSVAGSSAKRGQPDWPAGRRSRTRSTSRIQFATSSFASAARAWLRHVEAERAASNG